MSFHNRQEDLEAILNMKVGSIYQFNTHMDGGAEVERVGEFVWRLYEVPLYGGNPMLMRTCLTHELNDMIDEGYSWT